MITLQRIYKSTSMKVFEFNKYSPNEAACRMAFKKMRDREGVPYQHYGSHNVVWLESKQQYQHRPKVMVIAESTPAEQESKYGQKPKVAGHIKMVVVPDKKAKTIDAVAGKVMEQDSSLTIEECHSYIHFKDMFTEHRSKVIATKNIGKVIPWVHISIGNVKTLFVDMYHDVKPEFLQEYLNEFCYKFNRRYFGGDLFEQLVMIATLYHMGFEHRIYNKKAA